MWGADGLGVQGREEAQRGRSRAGCHPCPRDEREPPAQGLGTNGWKQKNGKEEKRGEQRESGEIKGKGGRRGRNRERRDRGR